MKNVTSESEMQNEHNDYVIKSIVPIFLPINKINLTEDQFRTEYKVYIYGRHRIEQKIINKKFIVTVHSVMSSNTVPQKKVSDFQRIIFS